MIDQEFVEAFPISELTQHPENPRRGDDAAVADSVRANGFYGAVIVHKATGHVLAGNTRLRVARADGEQALPAFVVDCDDVTARRILLADNRTSDLATYDDPVLLEMLLSVHAAAGDLVGTGFDDEALAELLESMYEPNAIEVDPDDVPPSAPRIVKRDDVWELGPHRLVCGDSGDPAAYHSLLRSERADIVWASPYVGSMDGAELLDFTKSAFDLMAVHTQPGACWFVTAPPGPQFLRFASPLTKLGVWRQTIVWVMGDPTIGDCDYHERSGALFYGWTPGAAHREPPDRKGDTVWEFDLPPHGSTPVALIKRALSRHSRVGQVVLDPFAGYGSSMIAAHTTNRHARMIEANPEACDVICARYERATGGLPVRNNEAVSFA